MNIGFKWMALVVLPAILGISLSWMGLSSMREEKDVGYSRVARSAIPAKEKGAGSTPALIEQSRKEIIVGVVSRESTPPRVSMTSEVAPAVGVPPVSRPSHPPVSRRAGSGKERRTGAMLAIVIDDIGHNLHRPKDFLALGLPLNFSILPGLSHSKQAARMILGAGRELLIHLPMEPFDYPKMDPGPSPLLLNYNSKRTLSRMKEYLAGFPSAIGVSNHMGSAYTYDAAKMRVVQGEVARHRLFFLNSKTSASPVPAEIARNHGYSYLERDVFLDNEPGPSKVRRQLNRAIGLARQRGQAIAIGHPIPATYRIIKEVFSGGSAKGVELSPISRLKPR